MTHSEQEEVLRRALHAVADAIEPGPDGLERIRERLSKPRPLAVAWLMAGWTGLVLPFLLRMEPAAAGAAGRLGGRLQIMVRSLRAGAGRLGPALERLRPVGEMLADTIRMLRPGSGMSRHEKLRSALAFGAAALIGAAGGFALSDGLPQQMFSVATQALSLNQPHKAGHGGHHANENGNGQPLTPGSSVTPSGNRGASPSPSSSCHPTPNPSSLPTATPPSSTPPTTTPPTTTPPTTTPPSTTPAIPGSTPADLNRPASGATTGPAHSATATAASPASHAVNGGATTPASSASAKPTPTVSAFPCG